jgi:hypothetical protein
MGRLTHHTNPGWTYFITTKATQNISVFQVKEVVDIVVTKMLGSTNVGPKGPTPNPLSRLAEAR